MMVRLENNEKPFRNHLFMEPFYKNEESDCFLYSEEGVKFNIHKEILYPTTMMRNIFENEHIWCHRVIEIFCPCSENELESIVNFLYNGIISSSKENNITKTLENLTKLFGFNEKLFNVEDQSKLSKVIKIEDNCDDEIQSEKECSLKCLKSTNTRSVSIQTVPIPTEKSDIFAENHSVSKDPLKCDGISDFMKNEEYQENLETSNKRSKSPYKNNKPYPTTTTFHEFTVKTENFSDLCDTSEKFQNLPTKYPNVKYLECNWKECEYKCKRNTTLKGHKEAIHLKIKRSNFECDWEECNYTCNRKTTLKAHKEAIHLKIKRYKCEFCEHQTYYKPDMSKHMERRHK